MEEKQKILIELDKPVKEEVERLARENFRSTKSQIEFIINRAIVKE